MNPTPTPPKTAPAEGEVVLFDVVLLALPMAPIVTTTTKYGTAITKPSITTAISRFHQGARGRASTVSSSVRGPVWLDGGAYPGASAYPGAGGCPGGGPYPGG